MNFTIHRMSANPYHLPARRATVISFGANRNPYDKDPAYQKALETLGTFYDDLGIPRDQTRHAHPAYNPVTSTDAINQFGPGIAGYDENMKPYLLLAAHPNYGSDDSYSF